jgi:uncharacterized protein YodC (DUF2158 family)
MSQEQDRIDEVRQMFQRAAEACQRQTGIRVDVKVAEPTKSPTVATNSYSPEDVSDGFSKVYDSFVDYDAPERQPRFNIGDIVIFNSGGSAMNVSNVNNYYPVVECMWTDYAGSFYCEVIPESCLRIYQEGSN